MIYIVSGYMRSGTSAMMTALKEGGMQLAYCPQHRPEIDGYVPCPTGEWEIGQVNYLSPRMTRQFRHNVAYKVFFDGLPTLPVRQYTIIFMTRDRAEIEMSVRAKRQYLKELGVNAGQSERVKPFDYLAPYNQKNIDHVLEICEHRDDMTVYRVDYHDLINSPKRVLESLCLPINVELAAGAIDSTLYRQRADLVKAS